MDLSRHTESIIEAKAFADCGIQVRGVSSGRSSYTGRHSFLSIEGVAGQGKCKLEVTAHTGQ